MPFRISSFWIAFISLGTYCISFFLVLHFLVAARPWPRLRRGVTWVVITTNYRYAHLLPQTVFLWKCRVGFVPLILYIRRQSTPGGPVQPSEEHLSRFAGVHVHVIEISSRFSDVTASQVIRLFAAFLPCVQDDDFLLTTDVDIWPINGTFWRTSPVKNSVFLFNYRCCGHFSFRNIVFPHYPMHSATMPARIWRQMIRFLAPNVTFQSNIYEYMANVLSSEFAAYGRSGRYWWNLDEMMLSYGVLLLKKMGNVTVVGYAFSGKLRVDRKFLNSSNEVPVNELYSKLDAHVHHSVSGPWNQDLYKRLAGQCLNQLRNEYID
jgi:hypothetical protein